MCHESALDMFGDTLQ